MPNTYACRSEHLPESLHCGFIYLQGNHKMKKSIASRSKKPRRPKADVGRPTIGIRELKAKASAIIDDVKGRGVCYAVTKRGTVEALIVPVDAGERLLGQADVDSGWMLGRRWSSSSPKSQAREPAPPLLSGLAQQYALAIGQLPHTVLVALDEGLVRQAAELGAQHKLRGADSVFLASAALFAAELVTLDRHQLKRGSAIVPTLSPADFLMTDKS